MRSPRMIARLAICCLLVALAVSPLFAQIPQRSDTTNTPVPGVGHNYVTSPIDTVNPANGALSIRIGVKMPSARGIQLPFSFAYDSNGTSYLAGSGGLGLKFLSTLTPFSQGGWSYSVPTLSAGKNTWTYTDLGDKQHTCTAAVNYVFQDPSGGRHDLDMSVWNGLPDCANFPMNNGNYVVTVPQGGEGPILSTTSSPLLSSGQTNPVSVTDGDGNLFSFGLFSLGSSSTPSSVTDRNGNYISISASGTLPFTYTDTVGRTALSISGVGGSPDSISIGGLTVPYYVHWTTITPTYSITMTPLISPDPCTAPTSHLAVKVISSITLPDGQSYTFTYDPVYGGVSKITLPNGGYIRYVWGLNSQSSAGQFSFSQPPTWPVGSLCEERYDTPAVTDRYVSYNGTTEVEHQHFSYTTTWSTSTPWDWTSKTSTETTYDLLRGTNSNTVTTYGGVATDIAPNTTDYSTGQIPLDVIVQHYSTTGSLLRTEYKWWDDERIVGTTVSILETGQYTQTNHFYGAGEVETERDDYDYATGTVAPPTSSGPPAPAGALLRQVKTTYATLAGNVLDKPSSVITYNGAATRLAETDYAYDQTAVSPPSGGTAVHWTSGTNIGNLTTKTEWLNTGTSPVTKYTYDNTGQLLTKIDPVTTPCPSGCVTTYSYTDSYTIGTPPGNTNAYLTTLTHPTTSGVAHVEKFKYSYTDGNPTQFIDQNNQTSTYKFIDGLDRLTEIDYPDSGKTLVTYMDSGSSPTITISKAMTSTQSLTNVSVMDGVGQPVQAQLTTDPAGTDYTDSTFDGLGLLWKKSNPHRTGSSPTDGTTTFTYDALKRTVSVTDPDTNVVSTSYTGNCSTVTDEAGKARKSCSDALGRMTQVFEDPAGLNYETDYTYDALGNLTNVVQKGGSTSGSYRNRSFVFDSLSRLTQTNNPETGTTNYTYDAVGDLLTKTDSRSIVTTFAYDALYRVTQKSYSDGVTPTANFVFDQCPSGGCPTGITPLYPIDRLVKSYTTSAQSYYNYDSMGRIATHWQCTPVNCGTSYFNLGYTYDQIGDQTVVSYNGSFTATTTYNGAADATALTSSLSDSQHPANLASAITYGPTGQPTALSYGNGLAETLSYNNRLQPQQLSTINSTTMANVLSMTLSFVDSVSGHNNGNLMSMSATGAQVISGRSYTYDSLNRLTTMSAPGDSSACTGLSWTYDAWGNRSAQTVTGGSCPDAFTTTFTQNNNRMDSYSYDAAGNLLGDGTHTYTYDGEGRILKVDGGSTATYVYDAEGRRIEKIKGSAQTHYWYGTDGQVRAEWNQSGAVQNDYLYLDGKMLAQYTSTTTMFAHLDHLGSTRLMTAVNGSTAECDDYLPFGEQLSYSGTHPCSNTADTTHKYTGQERDTETNLDKFEARYFSSTMGRFMIPDWDAKPVTVPYAHFGNPQSLNLYVYVSNNPLTFADPDGHDPELAVDKPHAAPGVGCGNDMECVAKAIAQTGMSGLGNHFVRQCICQGDDKSGPQAAAAGATIVIDRVAQPAAEGIFKSIFEAVAKGAGELLSDLAGPVLGVVGELLTAPAAGAGEHELLVNYYKENDKGARESTRGKHEKPRPGRSTTKDRQKKGWKPRTPPRPQDMPDKTD